ncbi:ABC transporter ATP-binding protein [Agrobacterium tumefaciens]|uniref:ABC transporter ATP-binding protein n=1 Tax=Agrobacterium tumefaciens TaxID=358 RepID=A0AA44F3D5_AGRTU|nr:ABC transporter ATP-binding protein [Agrobacterium tumefaciens]NSL23844.1 ABC transporter ATP-binding protein [Agrobacterium tumefaciens]NTB87105.1 ABC transporter ATP-binding protein [Agrobacterium tumefaciens]NTC15779.1 ABC transporter ATP-binding protein [Agrobacterium tumefaciens]NTC27623.1 ABC transporter ATP-binding protein [Agrobacterium tumefaciens]NTC53278.1 ABC transporter ATP-binding protein [Agrobacterium tumefaciens]
MIGSFLSADDKKLLARLFKENFKKHVGWYSAAIAAMVVVAGTTSLSAWIMRDIVNSVYLKQGFDVVLKIAFAVATIFIVKGLATFVQSYYLSKAGNSIVAEQQRKIYDRLLKQGVSFFQNLPSSELLIRVTYNAQAARSVIDTIVTSFIRDLLSLVGLIIVMFAQNFLLSAISMIIGPIAILSVRLVLRRVRKIMEAELASLGEIVNVVQETSIGVRVIKAFSLEKLMRQRMNKAVSDVEQRANGIAKLEAATSPIMETLSGLAIAVVIAVSGYTVLEKGGSPGDLMAFITALLLAYEPAKRLARMRVQIEGGMIGVRMMFEVLDAPLTLAEKKDAQPLPKASGNVELKNVSFEYVANQPVLKDVSVLFQGGKMTALVGPSGSGKSTIINLMMRLYDPQSGSVEINGMDLRDVSFASLREHVSYVGQETFLFSGTVKHNISVGRDNATDEEIIAAAKAANAHDFIMSMPDGYDSKLGENGSGLSGGQRQRVAIARAMLRDADILILDEATSALDSESEALVRDALERLTLNKTSIVIAHRLSTINRADKIVVMDNGQVVEQGSRRELLATDGLYKRLHSIQFDADVA